MRFTSDGHARVGNRLLHTQTRACGHVQEHALERLLLPLSGLTSWLIVLAGGLSLLHVLGINVAPLLTVGGVSGILVGLSAQSVMANMIAGINLVSLRCLLLSPILTHINFSLVSRGPAHCRVIDL